MSGFSPADVAAMADAQEAFLPDACTVERPTKTRTVAGGEGHTYANVYTDIPCFATARVLRQIAERVVGGQVKGGVRWEVIFARETDIRIDDKLTVTSAETGRTIVLHVTAILSPEAFSTAVIVNAVDTQ